MGCYGSNFTAMSLNKTSQLICTWLKKNGISVRDDYLKAELVEILKKIAPAPVYALD